MSPEFKNALSSTAVKLKMTRNAVFDEIIKLSVFAIFRHFEKLQNAQYDLISADESIIDFDFGMQDQKLSALFKLQTLLHEEMLASEPFQDILTPFYESEFHQFANRHVMHGSSNLQSLMASDDYGDDGEPEQTAFFDLECGTGTNVMESLRHLYHSQTNYIFGFRELTINEDDPGFLRVAIFQIVFNTFYRDAPLKSLTTKSAGKNVLVCKIKSPADRTAAMKAVVQSYLNW